MKKLVLLLSLVAAGCSSLSPALKKELNDCAVAGDVVQARWASLSDDQKRGFVFRFTRFCYDEKNSLYGDTIPVAYVTSK